MVAVAALCAEARKRKGGRQCGWTQVRKRTYLSEKHRVTCGNRGWQPLVETQLVRNAQKIAQVPIANASPSPWLHLCYQGFFHSTLQSVWYTVLEVGWRREIRRSLGSQCKSPLGWSSPDRPKTSPASWIISWGRLCWYKRPSGKHSYLLGSDYSKLLFLARPGVGQSRPTGHTGSTGHIFVTKMLLQHSCAHSHRYCLLLLLHYNTKAEWYQPKRHCLRSRNHLLFGSLQKKFADPLLWTPSAHEIHCYWLLLLCQIKTRRILVIIQPWSF